MFRSADPNVDKELEELTLPIKFIEFPKLEIRRCLDLASINELAQSLKHIGQLHRIGVRPIKPDTYELIYGERRLRAAILLGCKTIQATAFNHIKDGKAALTIAAAENLHTQKLKTIEHIAIIREFKSAGLDDKAIAAVLAQSDTWVQEHLFVMRDLIARRIAELGTLSDAHTLKNFMALPPSIRNLLLEAA
ncbi:MAG: ParB/RepB/Spo0J family partition protein [Burkholderiaceae bacterium]|nr:ParB/RepB/Spo0J family partition protein [Burkholderiaceae bacterium]